jgi:hypothetical protein
MNIEVDDKRLLCYDYFDPYYNINKKDFGEILYYGLTRKYFDTNVLNNFRPINKRITDLRSNTIM